MRLVPQHAVRGLIAAAAVAALAFAPGCDWLKSSGPGARSSPFLSGLSIEGAAGVFCGRTNDFQVSFRYDDPQDDIFEARLTFTHLESQSVREDRVLWSAIDLSTAPGRAITSFFFVCGDPGGLWEVGVQVEDAQGHMSNLLTGEIILLD